MAYSVHSINLSVTGKKILLLAFLLLGAVAAGHAQFQYRQQPALEIITDIEDRTSFRFLYRDALLSDTRLSFSATNNNLFTKLRTALRFQELNLSVDSLRKQVIIFEQKKAQAFQKEISVRGQVVDASTGERLPFANISWQQNGSTTGISANPGGSFRFTRAFARPTVTLRCTYIGYAPKTITLNVADIQQVSELTFRLQPRAIDANELIVTGTGNIGDITLKNEALVDIGTFAPLGESNSLRALQALPAVSSSPAISDGLHIRGSSADGFQVLLDAVPIYNQSHLFGLLDSFNADVLQRNNLFYDIAPARFQAPPGGTLSLDTRSGSLQEFSGTAGISNASGRLTLSGPLQKGKSSWLISGRKSFLNTINWLDNSRLIEWGLDVNRNRQVLSSNLVDFESQLSQPEQSKASFFDLHAKVFHEDTQGNRLTLSAYVGGDKTRQTANRLFESFAPPGQNNFDRRTVTSYNNWHNATGSIQYEQWLTDNLYAKSTAGGSFYQTDFSKEDFSYTQINESNGSLQNFIYPFENQSVLNELKANQHWEFYAKPWTISGGLSYHYFKGEYFEDSFDYPGYFRSQMAHQVDAYTQIDFTKWERLDLFAGTRLHYFSAGKHLRWSPRIKINLFPQSILSASAGFSRNHQFLNKVNLSNTVTADVWVLAGPNQPPTSVNYYSGGLYFDPSDYFYLQAEGYYKEFENLWLHKLTTFSLANSFGSNPWLTNNSGSAKGLEFLLRNQFSFIELNQTFTISEVLLSNPAINGGESFHADWDRSYQYNVTLGLSPTDHLNLYLSWMYASGTPNKLATFGPQNDKRLGDYRRTDLSVEYRRNLGKTTLQLTATIFNLLDRQNPWYRELTYVIDQDSSPQQFKSVPVDVYDIGLQPSFNISVTF